MWGHVVDELVAVAIGVVLGLLVLAAGVQLARRLDNRQEKRRQEARMSRLLDYNSDGRLSSAYAASDLVPWVLGMADLGGCRIQVFGGDGTYITQENGRVWRDGIKAWVEAGLDVDYLLLEIDEPTRKQYLGLMNELNTSGKVRLRVRVAQQPDSGYPDDVKETEGDLRTCHPTLLYGSDLGKRAMWIEGDHQANSELAYDVCYVPPGAMNGKWKAEFEHYECQVDAMEPYCVDVADARV